MIYQVVDLVLHNIFSTVLAASWNACIAISIPVRVPIHLISDDGVLVSGCVKHVGHPDLVCSTLWGTLAA